MSPRWPSGLVPSTAVAVLVTSCALVVEATDAVVVSPSVVAELDHLIATRHGVDHELAVPGELAGRAWDGASAGEDEL